MLRACPGMIDVFDVKNEQRERRNETRQGPEVLK
jgi:hypothetical protein